MDSEIVETPYMAQRRKLAELKAKQDASTGQEERAAAPKKKAKKKSYG